MDGETKKPGFFPTQKMGGGEARQRKEAPFGKKAESEHPNHIL